MKLYHKLGFAFVVLVVIMAFGLLYNTATAKQSMTHIIGTNTVSYNTQILAEIDRSIAVRIQEFQIIVSRDSIISLIKDSNQFYDEREDPAAYIQQQELHPSTCRAIDLAMVGSGSLASGRIRGDPKRIEKRRLRTLTLLVFGAGIVASVVVVIPCRQDNSRLL